MAPAAINWVATAAPHAESHGVTAWVVPAPLTVLNTNTDVLYVIHLSPAAGMQAPRALSVEVSRLLRLATVALMSEVEGSCRGGQGQMRVYLDA